MAAAVNYPVKSPQWVLTYENVNITADISSMVTALTYTDTLTGRAGAVEVALEDHQRLWQGPWYPQQGDKVNLLIGYQGEELLPCGDFEIDELELHGPPDQFAIRGLAAWITPAMRTRNNVGFEGQTLMEIASTIAAKYNLTVVGAANALNPTFARITQHAESDLAFLGRLARDHGYNFTVRGNALVFYAMTSLEMAAPVLTLGRSDILSFSFINKTHLTYKAATVAYQYPQGKQLITQSSAGAGAGAASDTLKQATRCENGQQATLKAESALHEMNKTKITLRASVPGAPSLSAGNVFAIGGFGAMDGNYLIETVRHRLTRERGYTSEVSARQVIS